MHRLVGDIQERNREHGHPLVFHVTSNGTLLNEEILAFLRQQRIELCISIDGPPKIHDRNRPFRNGRGSFDRVSANLLLAREHLQRVQVNVVYRPGTLPHLSDTVAFLLDAGLDPINLNADIKACWDEKSVQALHEVYWQLAEQFIARYRAGHEYALNMLDNRALISRASLCAG
ncbi:radical SAM protein [Thioflavicoccus mobilis]|nr:hypothetical protein [Thioflavicoccus mobilis]